MSFIKKWNLAKGLIYNAQNSAKHHSWSSNYGFKKLYKPFYYMFLMGLHSTVQMPKYLYFEMATALE